MPASPVPEFTIGPPADKAALAKIGATVRARLAEDPSVYRIPVEGAELFAVGDFLTGEECNRMVAMIDDTAKPSTVYRLGYADDYRTSFSGDFDPSDPFVRMIERRLSDLLGCDPATGETIQGQRYLPGQQFRPHVDWFDTAAEYWPNEKHRGGQRSWTAMAFLNEVEAGGDTHFTRLGISITPQPGALLVWNNVTPEGLPNFETMHAGTPVERGVKYVITKWFRARRWR
jgi:prolyl 4-hydroxylase